LAEQIGAPYGLTTYSGSIDTAMVLRTQANTTGRCDGLALDLEDYKLAVESVDTRWVFDESSSTLERYLAIDSTNIYLQVELRRHKQSDSITIFVEFANHTDDVQEPIKDEISILRRTCPDGELRVTPIDPHRNHSKGAASFEEIDVKIETHQIYNQLISTLMISPSPKLPGSYYAKSVIGL
jgi:hypothetical protein